MKKIYMLYEISLVGKLDMVLKKQNISIYVVLLFFHVVHEERRFIRLSKIDPLRKHDISVFFIFTSILSKVLCYK